MKKIFIFFLALALNGYLKAQAPQKMSYQSVVRNSNGQLLNNANVGVRISVLQGSENGTAVYKETHSLTTNINGLLSLEIGAGTVVTGSFANIDWANGPYFIKTETDPNGGSNYSIEGTSQLMSVAYALYAANSTPGPQGEAGPKGDQGIDGTNGVDGKSAYQIWLDLGNTGSETDFVNSLKGPKGEDGADAVLPSANNVGDMQYWNGTEWVIVGAGAPGQFLQFSVNNVPTWSGNSYASVTISAATDITTSGASFNANISSDGGEAVTARGFCISQSPNPTINDVVITSGSGIGSFTGDLTGAGDNVTFYVRAYATNSLGTRYSNQISFTTINIFGVGDVTPSGGIVFYDKGSYSDGWRYMEAAPVASEFVGYGWECTGIIIDAAKSPEIGAGLSNTQAIVSYCPITDPNASPKAAMLCDRLEFAGFSDWFLPSHNELMAMYNALKINNIGGFAEEIYWGSTLYDSSTASAINFSNGASITGSKLSDFRIRAARRF